MKRSPVKSSNLKTVGYDPATKTLEVEFHSGAVHQYAGITPGAHQALVRAPSIGSHFHQYFRKLKSTPVT
ncbi:MAG TPA: KTSC domain-containing protein [Candidatus Saccharimonadales bacterium]|nr:KTSC domain-containing protein [Candidatus Saccharimonadales bacterium]